MHIQDNKKQPDVPLTLKQLFIPAGDSRVSLVVLIVIMLLGALVRLILINQPIQYDEAYTFIHYASQPLKTILINYSAPNNHIFHTILVSITYHVLGGSPWILRLPAYLAGVLLIPGTYLAARRFYPSTYALGAAAAIAITSLLIEYSANGRGYTLLALFVMLLTNFAAVIVKKQTRPALITYGVVAAFGFYTIPIFLYPMAGISLWVVASYLVDNRSWPEKFSLVITFLLTCAGAGLLTFLLYSPVIFFGTGLASLVSNEIVESQNWPTFFSNFTPRLINTAVNWMTGIIPAVRVPLLVGFGLTLVFNKRISTYKLPLHVFLLIGALSLMLIQRVVPLFRVWIYLDVFYMLFSAVGLVWLVDILLKSFISDSTREKLLLFLILCSTFSYFVFSLKGFNAVQLRAKDFPEKYAAAYIQEHIQLDDTIIALPPVDIQTAYYLVINDFPYSRFYQPDHPIDIKNALVLLRDNSKYNTPQKVLEAFGLSKAVYADGPILVYEYGHLKIFFVLFY